MNRIQLPSYEEIFKYLLSFDLFSQMGRPDEGVAYAKEHLHRIIKTVELLPPLEGPVKVLELGATPYYMTLIMQKYLNYDITAANFADYEFGVVSDKEGHTTVSSKEFDEIYKFTYKMFNVERDPFPYEDEEFDLVLCCELIEHLLLDPSHMISEAHRVLKENGYIVVTTPNSARLENVIKLLQGKNIYDCYSGNGIYGRHNREYTSAELEALLKLHNFEPTVRIDNIHQHSGLYNWICRISERYRDNLFGIGRKYGDLLHCYPEWLYLHHWGRQKVTSNSIVMGKADILQLGSGWYGFENWPPGIRWTSPEATVFLKPLGTESKLILSAFSGPISTTGRIMVNGAEIGVFDSKPNHRNEFVFPLPETIGSFVANGTVTQLEVRLFIDTPFIPKDFEEESMDKRELGIAVERIRLE